jgi:hypothetical protein
MFKHSKWPKGVFVFFCKNVFKKTYPKIGFAFLSIIFWVGFNINIYGAEVLEQPEVVIPPELQCLPYAVYPDSLEYNTERLNFNKRFVYFPKAIFFPTNNKEIQYVLSVLKRYGLAFAIRSGRHCMEPGSLSSDYIIDLSKFKVIKILNDNSVFIGAGAQLGDVLARLGRLNFAIPTGTCPTVGISGLAGGGGIGLLVRQFGLTCDSVVSITLLNADAQIIEVDAHHYADLFWALRGGGNGSYGIVLGWTFLMYHIPKATFYELMWEWDPNIIAPIMNAWQAWVQGLSPQISSVLAIRHSNQLCAEPDKSPPLVIRIFGLKIGDEPFKEWENAFKTLNPEVKLFRGGYGELSRYWAKESTLPFNKCKSRILREPVGDNTISLVTQFFNELEGQDPEALIYFEFEAFGGAVPRGHTAFFPRKAFGWWLQAYYWAEQEQNSEILALSRKFYSEIPNDVSEFCYANIVDYDLGPTYLYKYYGDHVQPLIDIKRKYDPTDLFSWRQGIPDNLYEAEHR